MSVGKTRRETIRGASNRKTYEHFIRNMAQRPNMGEQTTNTSNPPAPPSVGVGQTPPYTTMASKTPGEGSGGFTLQADAIALGNPAQGDTVSFTVQSIEQGVAVLAEPVLLKNNAPPAQ